jgi:hypothetical protein
MDPILDLEEKVAYKLSVGSLAFNLEADETWKSQLRDIQPISIQVPCPCFPLKKKDQFRPWVKGPLSKCGFSWFK